jgi:hypothetical protein
MDSIDVGGASERGRPAMPSMTTVDESGAPLVDSSSTVYEKRGPTNQQKARETNERVSKAVSSTPLGAAHAAYPENHPANRDDIEQMPDGCLKLTKDTDVRRFDMHKPLGDVRKGYVTGPRVEDGDQAPPSKDVSDALEFLKREVEAVKTADEEEIFAHNGKGDPVIEVLFHLDMGVIASYHTHVIEQGRWLVFVDDNTQEAKQKFIPKPGKDPQPIQVTITGKDKVPQARTIVPLGINFTLGRYDIFVTMVKPTVEEEEQ